MGKTPFDKSRVSAGEVSQPLIRPVKVWGKGELGVLRRLSLLLLLLVGLSGPVYADVLLSFYSRDFGEGFPHAFVTLKGSVAGEAAPIDTSYGFTAVSISPAILMGPVRGKIETLKDSYIRKSQMHMAFTITDDQYRQVMAVVEEWRTRPGKSYDLNKRNCVFFVAAIGRALGLDVVENPKLMKKPRSFLDDVVRRNQQRLATAGTSMGGSAAR